MLRVLIYRGTREWINNKSHNKTNISDDQLHPMELCSYHGIKVQVEGLDGERISQMYRSTGSESWPGGDQQNHSVWVKQYPGRCYAALNGRIPLQLQQLSKSNSYMRMELSLGTA